MHCSSNRRRRRCQNRHPGRPQPSRRKRQRRRGFSSRRRCGLSFSLRRQSRSRCRRPMRRRCFARHIFLRRQSSRRCSRMDRTGYHRLGGQPSCSRRRERRRRLHRSWHCSRHCSRQGTLPLRSSSRCLWSRRPLPGSRWVLRLQHHRWLQLRCSPGQQQRSLCSRRRSVQHRHLCHLRRLLGQQFWRRGPRQQHRRRSGRTRHSRTHRGLHCRHRCRRPFMGRRRAGGTQEHTAAGISSGTAGFIGGASAAATAA